MILTNALEGGGTRATNRPRCLLPLLVLDVSTLVHRGDNSTSLALPPIPYFRTEDPRGVTPTRRKPQCRHRRHNRS